MCPARKRCIDASRIKTTSAPATRTMRTSTGWSIGKCSGWGRREPKGGEEVILLGGDVVNLRREHATVALLRADGVERIAALQFRARLPREHGRGHRLDDGSAD